jgi:hypothetical protein
VETITGVVIITNTITVQDLALARWADLFFIPAVLKGDW